MIVDTINTIGKMHPSSNPDLRLLPACSVAIPTIAGPIVPPKSPDIASKANIAVPPSGNCLDEMLIVPGHIIATENPQITHPISPSTGALVNATSK